MPPTPPRSGRGIGVLLAIFVLLAGWTSVVVPPFETPDEIWHFAFIHHLATGQGLPVSEPNTQALWRQQGVQAPGYYLVAAALTSWIDQSDFPAIYRRANPHAAIGRPDAEANRNYLIHHRDEEWPWRGAILALHLARFFSVALGAVTIWAVYRTLALLLDGRQALLGAALVAFIPQFVFISAAASNDGAVNALAALVLWRLTSLIIAPIPGGERAIPRRELAVLGVLLGLAVLSKLSALGLLGLTALAVIGLSWRARSWRLFWEGAWWTAAPALAIGGWWYVRNWQLYGDPLAWNIWQANILLRVEPADWRTIFGELESLERSFWGLFGWFNVPYPAPVYLLFRGLELLIAGGLLWAAIGRWRRGIRLRERDWAMLLLGLWGVVLLISWLRFMRIAPAAQGRYFFPAAPTLALGMVIGLGRWPLPGLGWGVATLLAGLSLLTPPLVIAPAYRPPPAQAHLAAELTPITARLGDAFIVQGVATQPDRLLPGQTATVTVAWKARQVPAEDYSIFVHLVDEDGLIVAQYDTMPGGGLYPTSQWHPGELRVERYLVRIPPTAYTPNQAHWAIGMYLPGDSATGVTAGHRLPVQVEAASPDLQATAVDDALRFGRVEIATPPGLTPNPLEIAFDDNITLAGYTLSRRRLRPGEPLTVTLYWRARGPIHGDYTTFVHLLDVGGQMHGGHDGRPVSPTQAWSPGQVVEDIHELVVSPQAPPGIYQLELGLYTWPDLDRLSLLASPGAEGADRFLLGPIQVEEARRD